MNAQLMAGGSASLAAWQARYYSCNGLLAGCKGACSLRGVQLAKVKKNLLCQRHPSKLYLLEFSRVTELTEWISLYI